MQNIIINRFSNESVNYQETLSDINENFLLITREKHKDDFINQFDKVKVFKSFDDYSFIKEFLLKEHSTNPIIKLLLPMNSN